MRPALLRRVTLALSVFALHCSAARADVLRVVATDARGVTLQVSTEAWTLSAPGADGRVRVIGVPEAHSLTDPGHALLPAYSTMLAVPPDAHPTLRVLSADAPVVREGVRLSIASKPTFTPGKGEEFEPGLTRVPALADGPWPREQALLGAVNSFRGRRLVGLEVRPFQYDEATGTLRATASLTLRVDFNRPPGTSALPATVSAPDAHADPVLRSTVLNFGQAEPWRVAPAGLGGSLFARTGPGPAATAAFDETQPEVRVTVDSTGVWLLPYDLLAANGYPAGTPIRNVSVHRHEFLEGSLSQPYATIELPIEVEDANHDGTFDSGDRIWAYVRNWAERSGASHFQRWWGDAEAIFATVNPDSGLRMAVRQGWRGSASPAQLASYPTSQHWEQNSGTIMPFINSPTDTNDVDIFQWTTQVFYYDRQDTIAFTANSIDTTHAVQFGVNWVGRSHTAHNDWAAVKNQLGQLTTFADSVVWSDKQARTVRSAPQHGSALSEGVNKLVLWGKSGTGAPVANSNDLVGFNWFEATYWRRFEAVHDVLACNNGGQAGEYQLHASGFLADSLRVYDVSTPEFPVRIHVDEAHVQRAVGQVALDLQDSVSTGEVRSYVIAAALDPLDPAFGPRVPAADHFARVTRLSLGTKTAADYIMVVPEAFLPAVQPLVALRQSLGMQVVVATAEDVYDEFNGGRHSAYALRRLAKYAYNRWNTRFLLLVGGGALDALDHSQTSKPDWIPVNPVAGPVAVDGFEVTVSDNIYGCITGNCDPIFGAGDVIPELMIGRLPVNSLAETQVVVNKIVAYEDLSGDPTWRRHLLLCSDDAFSGDAFATFGNGAPGYCWKDYEEHFIGLNQKVRSIVLRDAGLSQMNVENWNLRYFLAPEPVIITPPPFPGSPADTCRPDMDQTRSRTHNRVTPQLFASLNSGTLWWNYQGHANEFVLAHENLYVNNQDSPGSDDKWQFTNATQPLIFTAFSCHANMYARFYNAPPPLGFGGCLGEDMVTFPNGGAVASWASSCYEVVPSDDSTHLNVELARSMFASPPRDPQLWDHGSRIVLGEAIQAAYLRYLPMVFSSSVRGVAITYTLLGDPAMRVSIGRPQSIVLANGLSVTDGQRVRLNTPGDSLTLVADLVSTARLDSLGLYVNAGGPDSPVPASEYALSPAFPDTVAGGTYGGRRFRLTYGTHLPAQTRNYTLRVKDRDGLATTFTAPFVLDATLRDGTATVPDGDPVSPVADLSVMLISPAPIDPQTDVVMTINGAPRNFGSAAAPGDASGREWVLSWTHEPYAKGDYVLEIVVRGASNLTRRFKVTTGANELQIVNLFAFPNPFDDVSTAFVNKGTAFSYQLLSSDLADVRISIYTISGRRIWSQEYAGQQPGYHQVPWDGRDAEGDEIANGIYLFRVSASTATGLRANQLGRLVKLRRPRHIDLVTTP